MQRQNFPLSALLLSYLYMYRYPEWVITGFFRFFNRISIRLPTDPIPFNSFIYTVYNILLLSNPHSVANLVCINRSVICHHWLVVINRLLIMTVLLKFVQLRCIELRWIGRRAIASRWTAWRWIGNCPVYHLHEPDYFFKIWTLRKWNK